MDVEIKDWMLDLDMTRNERLVYASVYRLNVQGGYYYLPKAKWWNVLQRLSFRIFQRLMRRLVDRGLIQKRWNGDFGVAVYQVNEKYVPFQGLRALASSK